MSLSAAVLDALVQAGATREQLVAAMQADIAEREAAIAAKLDNKRKGNRERQQRKRNSDRNAESHVTAVTERDARDKGSNDRDILTSKTPVVSDETTTAPEIILLPEHVVEAWNDLSAAHRTLKPVQRLTPERRKKLSTRIAENTVDDFTEAIAAIGRSPFLRGDSDRGWRATFDWMLEPKNFTKLIEGTYDR